MNTEDKRTMRMAILMEGWINYCKPESKCQYTKYRRQLMCLCKAKYILWPQSALVCLAAGVEFLVNYLN